MLYLEKVVVPGGEVQFTQNIIGEALRLQIVTNVLWVTTTKVISVLNFCLCLLSVYYSTWDLVSFHSSVNLY